MLCAVKASSSSPPFLSFFFLNAKGIKRDENHSIELGETLIHWPYFAGKPGFE